MARFMARLLKLPKLSAAILKALVLSVEVTARQLAVLAGVITNGALSLL
jgi:hypothetical protein